MPKDSAGDAILDQADTRFRNFKTKAAAMRFAKKVHPFDWFGVVRVTPMRFVPYDEADAGRYPHAGFWDACGDAEHYEG